MPNSRVPLEQSMAWRIRVTFAGNLSPRYYTTPDVRQNDPGWGSGLFDRRIEKLEFFLPTGHVIVLAGMEQYNFFVEALRPLSRGPAKIEALWFCGKIPDQPLVDLWRVSNNKVIYDRKPWGQEWGGTATRGWRQGELGGSIISRVIKR
jgi:hypothetical protein